MLISTSFAISFTPFSRLGRGEGLQLQQPQQRVGGLGEELRRQDLEPVAQRQHPPGVRQLGGLDDNVSIGSDASRDGPPAGDVCSKGAGTSDAARK